MARVQLTEIQIPKFEPRPSHLGRQSENATFVTIVPFYQIQTLTNNQHYTKNDGKKYASKQVKSTHQIPGSTTAKDPKGRKADYVTRGPLFNHDDDSLKFSQFDHNLV